LKISFTFVPVRLNTAAVRALGYNYQSRLKSSSQRVINNEEADCYIIALQ